MDFEAEGLLEGLDEKERSEREQLLARLAGDGFTLDELKAAVSESRLALLPVDRVLGGRHTADEVQERTGMPAQLMLRIRRTAGLPDASGQARVFADEDIALARATKQFMDAGFGEEAIIEITRVLGEAMSRVAATTVAAFTEAFLQPGDSEQDVAHRFAALAEQMTPALTPVLVATLKAHLRDSVRRGMLGRAELQAGQLASVLELAVCFADLVGFTRLGGEIELQELGSMAGRLAQLASEAPHAPVRLVKTIGDAAMFVSPEPAAIVHTALRLVEAAKDAELPSLRAGIASGPATVRAGDYYGPSVNLASRVTGIARPGSVLCTQEVHDAAADAFEWSFAGRHKLKGVPGPVPLFRARPRTAEGAPGTDSEDPRARRRR